MGLRQIVGAADPVVTHDRAASTRLKRSRRATILKAIIGVGVEGMVHAELVTDLMRNIIDRESIALGASRHPTGLVTILTWPGTGQTSTIPAEGVSDVIVLWPDLFVDDGLRLLDENFRI